MKMMVVVCLFLVVATASVKIFQDNGGESESWKYVRKLLWRNSGDDVDDRLAVLVGDFDNEILFEHTNGGDIGELVSVGLATKWVTAYIILKMHEEGVLSLSDTPSKYLPFWNADGGLKSRITLRDLLTSTSGLGKEHECVGNENYGSLEACAQLIYSSNLVLPFPPGTGFYYSGNNDVVAGAMALRAARASSWNVLVERYVRSRLAISKDSFFYLPYGNPSLSEGLFTSTSVYMEFLSDFYATFLNKGSIVSFHYQSARPVEQVGPSSPVDLAEGWRYNLGYFTSTNKQLIHMHPATSFYPLIDQTNDYYLIVKASNRARQILEYIRPAVTNAVLQARGVLPSTGHGDGLISDSSGVGGGVGVGGSGSSSSDGIEGDFHLEDDISSEFENEYHNVQTSDSQIIRAKATVALIGVFVLITMAHIANP